MEKNTRSISSRCRPTVVVPPSPSFVRSRSGNNLAEITTPERGSRRFSSSERFTNNNHRSKSTSKIRTNDKGNTNPKLLVTSISSMSTKLQEKNGASKRTPLPSAWALSPGRQSLASPVLFESPVKADGGGGNSSGGGRVSNGVTKVLNYFKQRKVSSRQEDMYHRFRMLHNRLLQWRYVNGRAEVARTNVKNAAEIHLFSVWLKMLMLRKIIIQKRIELQKGKHMIKLYLILKGQLSLLTEWEKLEEKNQKSIGRLTRKLSAMSTTLPLTHDLKADTKAIFEALNIAIKVMENIKSVIMKYQTQIERILYQVTELTTTSKQEQVCLQELLGIVPTIATLLENEKTIRVHLIQTKMESNTGFEWT